MKQIFISLLVCLNLSSCFYPQTKVSVGVVGSVEYYDWDSYYEARLTEAQSPVILVGKEKSMGLWGVTLKTRTGEFISIGNLVTCANHIGASHSVGDTIK